MTDIVAVMVPTIHLNGTGEHELLQQHIDALGAVRRAISVVREAAPNGRDYYPQGWPDAINKATGEHTERLAKLEGVRLELEQIAEAISDGGQKR